MKFFAIILSTFILVLSIVPFEDDYCGIQCEEISASNQQDSGNHNNESCPPICGCQCVHIQVAAVSRDIIETPLISVKNTKLSRVYDEDISFDLINSIWHPPKLS
tara:strand:- start:6942 stop:7256 length:315 start_codon:yes stop_codon:yes gene_type:complete